MGGGSGAYSDDLLVNCPWARMLIVDGTYCDCSSDGCFPQHDLIDLSLTLSEDGQSLLGVQRSSSGLETGTIELTRVN